MTAKASTTISLPTLTQNGATIALRAAEVYASETGVPMSIAIVDAHAHLLSFTRMDNAKLSSIDTAISMAVTSSSNRLPTSALSDPAQALNITTTTSALMNTTSLQRLCTLPGGLPIIGSTGALLGAIGCSTGTSLQGEDAAVCGRDAVLALIRLEAEEEERRIEDEREKVLQLWKEKEGEVEELRERLEGGGGKRRKVSNAGVSVGGLGPDTPPEEGEIGNFLKPSFVGEVRVEGY